MLKKKNWMDTESIVPSLWERGRTNNITLQLSYIFLTLSLDAQKKQLDGYRKYRPLPLGEGTY